MADWGVTEPANPADNGGGNDDKPDDGEADTENTEDGGATALLSAATAIALILAF